VTDRKQRFDAVNKLVTASNGWVTSIRGAPEIVIECLPGSTLPDELRDLGYDLHDAGEGERILPAAIVERFTKNADGTLGPLTEGSTKPVTAILHHAGIATVQHYGIMAQTPQSALNGRDPWLKGVGRELGEAPCGGARHGPH
jgi:hypothetical protein